MGQQCSQLYDVPRPNPKDPTITACNQFAITETNIDNNVNLNQAIIDAKYYCNDAGNNPKLTNSFNSLAGQAQQDPQKYGKQYYDFIIKEDGGKTNNTTNLYKTPTKGYVGNIWLDGQKTLIVSLGMIVAGKTNGLDISEGAKHIIMLLRGVIVSKIIDYVTSKSVKFATKKILQNIFGNITDDFVAEFWSEATSKFLADVSADGLAKALGTRGFSILKNFIKDNYSDLYNTVGQNLGHIKTRIKGSDPEEIDENPASDTTTNPTFDPEEAADAAPADTSAGADAAADAGEAALEDTGEELAGEAAVEAGLDAIPGVGEVLMVAMAAQAVFEVVIDAIGSTTIKYETAYCNNIGDVYEGDSPTDTEWTVYDYGTSCHFNDVHRGYAVDTSAGCCKTACAIYGKGLKCVRQNFRADPFVCCFSDNSCNTSNEDTCFQTPDRQRTCHPLFRDLSTSNCQDVVYDYCSGEKLLPGQSDWLEMWLENSSVNINSQMSVSNLTVVSGKYNSTSSVNQRGLDYPLNQKQPCLRAIARAVSTNKICTWDELQGISVVEGNINTQGFIWARNLLERVVDKYNSEGGGILTGINTDGVNRDGSFYNTLWQICQKIPNLCTNILNNMCSDYTAEKVATSPFLIPWCSCYLPDDQYEKYEAFGISKECTPLCNQTGVIPAIEATGRSLQCTSSICLVDNTSIDLVNTRFSGSGSININQLCGTCGNSNVTETYSAGKISTNTQISLGFYMEPPTQDEDNSYVQVFGSGFNITQVNQPSLVIPESDYNPSSGNITPSNNLKYNTCNLVYGAKQNSNIVGVVNAFIIQDSNAQKLSAGNYYVGFDPDTQDPLFSTQGSAALITLVKSTYTGATTTSQTTNTYAQQGYQVSLNTCQCITSGISLKTAQSKISGKINFTEQCGSQTCYNSNNQPIPCSSTVSNVSANQTIKNIQNTTIAEIKKKKFNQIFFTLFGLFLIAAVILVILFLTKNSYRFIKQLLSLYQNN